MDSNRVRLFAKWLLRLTGMVVCLSVFAIFLPNTWMNSLHASLGLGPLPKEPIVEYLARSLSAMYFAHGMVALFVSFDVRRYWGLVGLLGGLNVFLGSVFFWVDWRAPMPWFWTWLEGPPIIIMGLLLLFLWNSNREP